MKIEFSKLFELITRNENRVHIFHNTSVPSNGATTSPRKILTLSGGNAVVIRNLVWRKAHKIASDWSKDKSF